MSNKHVFEGLKDHRMSGSMTGHGFRGVASTLLHEQGFDHEHIELQLAHQKRDQTSAAYNHALHLPARAAMMQHWAATWTPSGRKGRRTGQRPKRDMRNPHLRTEVQKSRQSFFPWRGTFSVTFDRVGTSSSVSTS